MKKDTVSAYRARARQADAWVAEGVAAVKAARDREYKDAKESAAKAEAERVRLTRDDILGATHVRDRFGWHKVVRVNRTTVSVETGYSWVDRIEFDLIHEVRK